MLTLASMIFAAFAFVGTEVGMLNKVPMPVVIEVGIQYKYDPIEDAIYVPANWSDSCENQTKIIQYMAEHFSNFKNGSNKFTDEKITNIAHKWKCVGP